MSKKANTFMLRVGTRVNRNVVWTTKNTSYSFLLIRSLNRQNIFDFMLTGAGISLNKTFFGFSNKRLFSLLDCFSYLLFKKFFSRMNIVFSSTAPQKSDAFYISKNISFLNNSVRRLRSDSSLQSLLLKKAENSFFTTRLNPQFLAQLVALQILRGQSVQKNANLNNFVFTLMGFLIKFSPNKTILGIKIECFGK
jgi:hypothetical protein